MYSYFKLENFFSMHPLDGCNGIHVSSDLHNVMPPNDFMLAHLTVMFYVLDH
jgi:hypothetical protein